MNDYADEDIGNIISLEHVNVQIPDQSRATLFYVVGLGLTRDPYLNVGLNNMWVNVGEQQFHLPTRNPQIIEGHVGIVVPDLDALEARLKAVAEGLKDSKFSFSRSAEAIAVTCPWGNRYRCYASQAAFGDMTLGFPYVEFLVPVGAMGGILRFYDAALGAPVTTERDREGPFGRVRIGRHQSLISEDVRNHQFRFKDIVDPESGLQKFTLEHEVRSLKHPMYHRPFVNRDPGQSQRGYRRGWDALTPFQR